MANCSRERFNEAITGLLLVTHHAVQHNGIPPESLLSYLGGRDQANIAPSAINPYGLKQDEVLPVMLGEISDDYERAQASLVKGHGWFNDHRIAHITRTATIGSAIVQEAGKNDETVLDTMIAAIGHDAGNMYSRAAHHWASVFWFQKRFPALLEEPERASRIFAAICHHNEPFYDGWYTGKPFDDRMRNLRDFFQPSSAALLIADKTDVGRQRVHPHARCRDGILAHEHSELNMLWQTSEVGIAQDHSRFIWSNTFTPYLKDFEHNDFSGLNAGNDVDGHAVCFVAPERRNDCGIADFRKAHDLFVLLYGPVKPQKASRMQLAIESAFYLYPDLPFELRYDNPDNLDQSITYMLTPDTIDAQIEEWLQQNAMRKTRHTYS